MRIFNLFIFSILFSFLFNSIAVGKGFCITQIDQNLYEILKQSSKLDCLSKNWINNKSNSSQYSKLLQATWDNPSWYKDKKITKEELLPYVKNTKLYDDIKKNKKFSKKKKKDKEKLINKKLVQEEKVSKQKATKGDLEGLLFILEEANERGEKINYDTASKQYGFKNFKNFVKIYSLEYDIEGLTVKQAKEFLKPSDDTVEIIESQENLDKLYSLILNNKDFKKQNTYFKVFKKGKYKGNNVDKMALAAYINYEKEMAKITNDPKLKEISRFTWNWGYAWGNGNPKGYAMDGCKKSAEKYKLFGGECILIDLAIKKNNEHINLLKPRLNISNKKIVKQTKKILNPVTVKDHVENLGIFNKLNLLPKGMEKKIGSGCNNSFDCRAKKAASRMSKIFRKSDEYQAKNPGDMFYALAYFEVFYEYQLKKKKKRIARFLRHWPEKNHHGKTIVTLLKFNKARLKMREALGMNLDTPTEEAIKKFWVMGEYLNKGKIVKKEIHPDIKKRKKLLSKYKAEVSKFKSKIEQEKDQELYNKIYMPVFKKFKLSKLKKKVS